MGSQYTDQYLAVNKTRGTGKGYTLQTFLKYQLRGKAARYADRYLCSLEKDILSRSDVVAGKSIHNGIAYYPKTEN